MMARAMMHHVLTSGGEGVSGFSSTRRCSLLTSNAGTAHPPPNQEPLPFHDSCSKPQYDPFCCPIVAFETSTLRELINSEQEGMEQEHVSTTTEEEDCDTGDNNDAIVVRLRQLSRQ